MQKLLTLVKDSVSKPTSLLGKIWKDHLVRRACILQDSETLKPSTDLHAVLKGRYNKYVVGTTNKEYEMQRVKL